MKQLSNGTEMEVVQVMQKKWSAGAVAAVAALAVAAGGGTAFAGPPGENGVPAGKVEHAVWTIDVSGSSTIAGVLPRHQRSESWVTATRGRSLVTNLDTGKVDADFYQDETGLFSYNAFVNTVFTSGPQPEWLAIGTQQDAAGFERFMLDHGRVEKNGTTTFAGRTVLKLDSPGDVSGDEPGDKVRVHDLVDPETFAPVRKVTDVTDKNGKTLHQVHTLESLEVVDEASLPAGTLAFGDYPDAKRKGGADAAKVGAKRPAAPKAKAKSKKKGKAKHKATRRAAAHR